MASSAMLSGTFSSSTTSGVLTTIGQAQSSGGRYFNLSLSGLSSTGNTIVLQRSFDGGNTWKNVASYTSDIETFGFEPGLSGTMQYRLNCTVYSSGTVTYNLG